MERKKIERNEQKWAELQQIADKGTGLTAGLAGCARYSCYGQRFNTLWDMLTKEYGKEPFRLTTLDQFWNPALVRAVTSLTGSAYAAEIYEILKLRMDGQYSYHMWRHSYHSKDFGYYASAMIHLLSALIQSSCITQSVEELLYCNTDAVSGYKYRLALEIRRGNLKVISLVREAIMGDNSEVLISRAIIEAVIISGHEALVEDLMKLLIAARLQEGVRQQILESADVGSTKVLARIIKLCLDEDLFRYSSTIRAFDTWSGLGYGDAKPTNVKKCAEYAYACLTDEAVRREYMESENTQQAYFALWAMGCYEIRDTEEMTEKLLSDKSQYRRVLGWLFVSRSNSDAYKLHFARKYIAERDEELLAWIISCLPVTHRLMGSYHQSGESYNNEPERNELFPENKAERKQLFGQLKEAAIYVGNKNRSFTGNPFDFISITLESTRIISCMMGIAGYDMNVELIDELIGLQHLMNADQRRALIIRFLRPMTRKSHRIFLREALNDRSVLVKEVAVDRLSACWLENEDYDVLSDSLRSKSSPLRKAILSVFRKQSVDDLKQVITSMLSSQEEFQNQAAIELLLELKEEHPQILTEYSSALDDLRNRKISTQTQILLEQLSAREETTVEYTKENGYGLYSPAATAAFASGIAVPASAPQKTGFLSKLFGKKEEPSDLLNVDQIRAMLPVWENLDALLDRMNQVFERHKDYEYEVNTWDGRTKVLFGNSSRDIMLPADYGLRGLSDKDARIEMVPFYEEFLEAMGVYATKAERYIALRYITGRNYSSGIGEITEIAPWFQPYEKLQIAYSFHSAANKKYGERYFQSLSFIEKAHQKMDSHELYETGMKLYRSLVSVLGEENLGRSYTQKKENPRYIYYGARIENYVINYRALYCMRSILRNLELNPEDYKDWFLQEYRIEKMSGVLPHQCLVMEDYFRACEEGFAPRDALMEFLIFAQDQMPRNIKELTNPNRWPESRKLFETYPWAADITKVLVERIVQVEEKRGELPTDLTSHAQSIERFEGAEHFCNLLAALGKESFFRGYEYSSDNTKKSILSRLLKRCYPAKEDTPERLAELLKQTDISDKRLAEAVMYAPQWAGFAEKILGWKGLKCGVWFFHAHINETFSAEKETEVAIWSPISPQQFNDGAFDKNWFFQAYEQLGEKRFQILYKSAKYITSGSNQHRRSQLYADAVLGKLDAGELLQEIVEKRNQEKLRCYPLIPIADGDKQEALRRYEFIQKFLKESKQFGAQRRDSEKKACATAMENLAITTGLMDVNRLIWQMESAKMDEIRPYMAPVVLDGVTVRLEIDTAGDAAVTMEKNGKAIKTAPKSFAKDEYFQTLKGLAKDLKDQKRRAKESMERAMTESTQFGAEELVNIICNPVISPIVVSLVWTDETDCGFLRMEEGNLILTNLSGEEKTVNEAQLRIAHPYDLRTAGEWAGYMHLLYEKKLVQPFKQVFREYYPITEDEKQQNLVSRRYAGHQVQPKKTVALLKTRGWTVDYEEGLQKVCYKENLIVRMYALADWFSPAEIEAPTLETIRFYDRSAGEPVELDKVPPIVFSETMRDIDLVVSVAHVGGVDPEASHSTVEMRVAIAAELVQLLKLHNVSWLSAHAKIQGKLGSYSVHMGSGVVHAEGKGMIAILPVHSQARGRIFLPFADDDPKTAEIMSKIILLAEDNKIKDPSILNQIC